jgi:branched-chain amino acid transport system substrate-binding protein
LNDVDLELSCIKPNELASRKQPIQVFEKRIFKEEEMSVNKSIARLVGLMLVVSIILVGCAPATPQPAAPAATEAAPAAPTADTSTIIIGMVAPMTGDLADFGTQVERGIRLAMDEINAKGGINGRKLDLKICDDQCNPQQAAACAQKLATDPTIFAVIGHICSSCTLAGGPIYNDSKMTVMTVNSSNPKITEQGWKYMFRSTPTDAQQGAAMVVFATQKLGAKKIAMIYSNDDYGMGLAESAKGEISKAGAEVVAEETFITGQDKDFSSQLTKIAQSKPDVLFDMGQYAEAGLIAKQRTAAGLGDIPLIVPAAAQHQEFIDLGGPGAEGAYVAVFYDLAKQTPQNLELVKKIEDKYGEKPGEQVPWGYDGMYIFAQAIQAGATKATMPEFLSKVVYDGVTGHIVFDDHNQVVGLVGDIDVVQNGQFVTYGK